jgi:hypothetical protein
MSKLSVVLGAETSKFVHEVDSARHMLNKFIEESKKVADTSKANVSASDEQIQAYSRVISQLEKVASGTLTTAQQEKALTEQIKELGVQWQNLSEDIKQGDFGKSLSDTMSTAKNELESLKQKMANVDDVKPTGNLKKELRQTTDELVKLTQKYREMSAAEQAGSQGQELLVKMDKLRSRAAELSDTIGDVNQEIKALASDTTNLDAFNQTMSIGGDILSTYSSIVSRVTGDEVDLKNAISTFMMVQSAANTMTKISNALQSNSIVMLKVRKIQEAAAAAAIRIKTAAEAKSTVATKGATIAQAAFNAVANANPYVLLATALIAVGSALIGFTRNAKDATKEMKDLNEEAGKGFVDNIGQEFADSYGSIAGRMASTMSTLLMEWDNLTTDLEKTDWIKKNQNALKQLGFSIENLGDATNAFDTYRSNLAKYLDELASLSAKRETYEKTIAERVKVDTRYIDTKQFRTAKAGDQYQGYSAPNELTGLREGEDYKISLPKGMAGKNIYTLTESGAKKVNDNLEKSGLAKAQEEQRKELEKIDESLRKQFSDYEDAFRRVREEEKKLNELGIKTGDSSIDSKEVEYATGSLTDLENKLSDLQKKYKDGVLKITPEQYKAQVDDLEKQISNKKIELGLEANPDIVKDLEEESLTALNERLSKLKKDYEDGIIKITPEDYKRQVRELEEYISKKRIKLGLDPYVDENSLQGIRDRISEKEAELNLAIDDQSRLKVQRELDALKDKQYVIELKLSVNATEADVNKMKQTKKDHSVDMYDLYRNINYEPIGGVQPERLGKKQERNAQIIKMELDYQRDIVSSLQDQYDLIQNKAQAGGILTAQEADITSIYNNAANSIKELSKAYNDAANSADKFRIESEIGKHRWEGIKSGISVIGSLTSSVDGLYDKWSQWDKVMKNSETSDFKKTIYAITTCISTMETFVNTLDTIINVMAWFNKMSDLKAAKVVANNTTEMTSDAMLLASKEANTAAAVANNETEMTSEVAKIAVKEGSAIASATASGAIMPFPYNIAAIAAGIAAVVGAFALIKGFANGGIVSGGSISGDTQFARVNSGEMILNGTQQKRLFNILDGTSSRTGNNVGQTGEVVFKIKGNTLYGVLDNYVNKNRKI